MLGGPGLRPPWGQDIRTRQERPHRRTKTSVQWVPDSFPGGKAAGEWSWLPSLSCRHTSTRPLCLHVLLQGQVYPYILTLQLWLRARQHVLCGPRVGFLIPAYETHSWARHGCLITAIALTLTGLPAWLKTLTWSYQGLLLLTALRPLGGDGKNFSCWMSEFWTHRG